MQQSSFYNETKTNTLTDKKKKLQTFNTKKFPLQGLVKNVLQQEEK